MGWSNSTVSDALLEMFSRDSNSTRSVSSWFLNSSNCAAVNSSVTTAPLQRMVVAYEPYANIGGQVGSRVRVCLGYDRDDCTVDHHTSRT